MVLHKGQVFRFLGRDGEAKAAATERELQGACTRTGNQLQMTETRVASFGRVGRMPSAALPFVAADFFGHGRDRTAGLSKNGSLDR